MPSFGAFDISASGMNVERVRMELTALNLANVHTTRTENGGPFRPLYAIVESEPRQAFSTYFDRANPTLGGGVKVTSIEEQTLPPKLVYEPNHPDANGQGIVEYPNINPVSMMIQLVEITRAYEANVRAFNAAKSMAIKAMEIGGK